MTTTCTDCHEPITPEDLVMSPGLGTNEDGTTAIPGTPYHKNCYKKMQEEYQRDFNTRYQKRRAEEEDNNIKLSLDLLKGLGFLNAAEELVKNNPIYYDITGAWWVWNTTTKSWQEQDETDLLNTARTTLQLLGDTSVRHSKRIIDALKQVGRQHKPLDLPRGSIQFKNVIYNIYTKKYVESTPEYFSTNPIPWSIGTSEETPQIDKLITEWVGEEHKQSLYEVLAYCLYPDYPIHRMFYFVGTGSNGKTKCLKIIDKLVGEHNTVSANLRKISTNNFALYPLYRKLVCFIGETTHHRLDTTDILKALSGQDPVSFEAKGRNQFTGYNYAKLIVGTNVMPPGNDTSDGWYRRQFMIKFPNQFSEGRDVIGSIPDWEYENLCAKLMPILQELLDRGAFTGEGTIKQRQERYIEESNPLGSFIDMHFMRDVNASVRYTECYLAYLAYLAYKKMRKVSKREFTSALDDEGLETQRTSTKDITTGEIRSYTVIQGIERKPQQHTIQMHDMRVRPDPSTQENDIYTNKKVAHIVHNGVTNPINDDYEKILSEKDIFIQVIRQNGGQAKLSDINTVFPHINITTLIEQGILFMPTTDTVKVNE